MIVSIHVLSLDPLLTSFCTTRLQKFELPAQRTQFHPLHVFELKHTKPNTNLKHGKQICPNLARGPHKWVLQENIEDMHCGIG